jgi:hypothetical protein
MDYLKPGDAATNWYSEYQLGLLKVYIHDMEVPILTTPLNLAFLEILDDIETVNPNTGTQDMDMAGKAYISMVASNHLSETD